VTEIEK